MKNMKLKSILGFILILLIIGGCLYIAVEGTDKNKSGSAENIKLGLDLAGGVSITYETEKAKPTDEELDDAITILRRRVDQYSTESDVYKEGSNRINVDIPGVTNANEILEKLGKPGALQFVDETGKEILSGKEVKTADAVSFTNQMGQNEIAVSLEFTDEGAKKFADATKPENQGKRIAIIYNEELVSAPTIQAHITDGKGQISPIENIEEARELASTIRIGALPVKLNELRSNIVGAKLGQDAVKSSILAGLIGLGLVILFMIIFYRLPGLAAGIALTFYAGLILTCLNLFNMTLTLPGVAGIILSIGMAVDANVIIFSRIREELAQDKSVKYSIKAGFNKATSAIIDGNVTTLIAAVVLYYMGTGPIKGFAETLGLGIILSLFTALIVTRLVMTSLLNMGFKNKSLYGVQKEYTHVDFLSKRKIWFAISIVVIIAGLIALLVNKQSTGDILNYDIEFKGGTTSVVEFNETFKDIDEINQKLAPVINEAVPNVKPQYQQVKGTSQVIIKTMKLNEEQRSALEKALVDKFGVKNENISSETISPTVSTEMRRDAIIAVILAAIFMLIYITFRFKDVLFGASAVIALIHDVLVVLTVYAVLGLPINNSFIAAMLTIVGYSINDTIVLFDRIRENKIFMKKNDTEELINSSINQTMVRSINTSLTTFVTIATLFVVGFGIQSLKEFALPLMVGVLSGTYSSIFIASPLWYIFRRKKA